MSTLTAESGDDHLAADGYILIFAAFFFSESSFIKPELGNYTSSGFF